MNQKTISKVLALTFMALLTAQISFAQKSDNSEKLSASLSLNHDAFFGFNPALAMAYPVSKKADITFYGIIWGAGTGRSWGNWTEFGAGVNFKAGSFGINPQLGFTMGSLLSSGGVNSGVIGDGIVPNLTVNYDDGKVIGQLYSGYYAALQDKTDAPGESTNNYVHYWLNAGYKVAPWFAIGAHYEQLYLSGGKTNPTGTLARTNGYNWVGPFVQVSKKAVGMRFSFGKDVDKGTGTFSRSDFYKLAFTLNL